MKRTTSPMSGENTQVRDSSVRGKPNPPPLVDRDVDDSKDSKEHNDNAIMSETRSSQSKASTEVHDDIEVPTQEEEATSSVPSESRKKRKKKDRKPLQERWEEMFNRLLAFKEKFGHCLVPNRYADDPSLGAWVSTQRRQYKVLISGSAESCPMTPERATRLMSIGFAWATKDPRHVPWEVRFGELCDFKKKYGHCSVPIGYKDNVPLSYWVSTQRQEYKLMREGRTSRMTPQRAQALDAIGFVWEGQRGGQRTRSTRNNSDPSGSASDHPSEAELAILLGAEADADSAILRSQLARADPGSMLLPTTAPAAPQHSSSPLAAAGSMLRAQQPPRHGSLSLDAASLAGIGTGISAVDHDAALTAQLRFAAAARAAEEAMMMRATLAARAEQQEQEALLLALTPSSLTAPAIRPAMPDPRVTSLLEQHPTRSIASRLLAPASQPVASYPASGRLLTGLGQQENVLLQQEQALLAQATSSRLPSTTLPSHFSPIHRGSARLDAPLYPPNHGDRAPLVTEASLLLQHAGRGQSLLSHTDDTKEEQQGSLMAIARDEDAHDSKRRRVIRDLTGRSSPQDSTSLDSPEDAKVAAAERTTHATDDISPGSSSSRRSLRTRRRRTAASASSSAQQHEAPRSSEEGKQEPVAADSTAHAVAKAALKAYLAPAGEPEKIGVSSKRKAASTQQETGGNDQQVARKKFKENSDD